MGAAAAQQERRNSVPIMEPLASSEGAVAGTGAQGDARREEATVLRPGKVLKHNRESLTEFE